MHRYMKGGFPVGIAGVNGLAASPGPSLTIIPTAKVDAPGLLSRMACIGDVHHMAISTMTTITFWLRG